MTTLFFVARIEVKWNRNRLEPRSARVSLDMAGLGKADTSADAQLAKMGYKAELPRNLSMMSILGMYVFSITLRNFFPY